MTNKLVRRGTISCLVLSVSVMLVCSDAHGAIEPRSILKTYFETGDVPTEQQFANLIDSYVHQTDDGLTLVGIGSVPNGSAARAALRVGGNVGINETLPDTFSGSWTPYTQPHPPLPQMCPMFCGTSGFLPLKYEGANGPHYGFLQIDMAADPGASPGAAIYVTQLVWESSANTSLTTFAVPEPTAAVFLLGALPFVLRRRR